MCRYAMHYYKPHYACFECRKTFKRRLMWDIQRGEDDMVPAKCPQCGTLMASMGLDFTAPKKDDVKAWAHLKTLYTVGITFHSCGCSGPGYIPGTKEAVIEHFENMLITYQQQLAFWRQRQEPQNKKEEQRDKDKNWDFITKLPHERWSAKGPIKNEDAKMYWIERIKEVETKLKTVRQ